MIDALPTGSLFSFLWNMLVSISFQFVGFLLTYLLHTTHAAKLGSRAGLGITLIQYGFAMRGRAEEWSRETSDVDGWGWQSTDSQPNTALAPVPTFGTAAEANEYYKQLNQTMWPSSVPIPPNTEPVSVLGDATTEWLSFFLMTVGKSSDRSLPQYGADGSYRLVRPFDIAAQLLACKALGTGYPFLDTLFVATGSQHYADHSRDAADAFQPPEHPPDGTGLCAETPSAREPGHPG